MDNLLTLAVNAAICAGNEILKIYNSSFNISFKDDKSPLTTADIKAHETIVKILEATQIPILSEEGKHIPYAERKNWQRFWLVDPLDGTKEFINKNGEFTVNIALIENNAAILGVIFCPVLNMLYFGSLQHGAFKLNCTNVELLNFEKITELGFAIPLETKKKLYTIVASRSHLTPETAVFIENIKNEKGNIETITAGSSLKFCLVAEGKADIYPRFGRTMEWDTAAGQAILVSAGGSVVNTYDKTALHYNKEDLANPYFIAELKKMVNLIERKI